LADSAHIHKALIAVAYIQNPLSNHESEVLNESTLGVPLSLPGQPRYPNIGLLLLKKRDRQPVPNR
jgi:hypothetical protein